MLGFYRLICGIQPIYHQKPSRLRWLQRLDKHTNSRHIFPYTRNLSNQGHLHLLLHHFASQWIPWKARYPSPGMIKWTTTGTWRSSSALRGSGGRPRKNQTGQNLLITFKYVLSSWLLPEVSKHLASVLYTEISIKNMTHAEITPLSFYYLF